MRVLNAIGAGLRIDAIAGLMCTGAERLGTPGASVRFFRRRNDGSFRQLGAAASPPVAVSSTLERYARRFETGSSARRGLAIRIRDGAPGPGSARARLICAPEGSVIGAMLLWHPPVAARFGRRDRDLLRACVPLAEAALAHDMVLTDLEQNNERFSVALLNMSQGLCFFDGTERLVLANRRYAEIYGLAPEAVRRGMTFREIIALRVEAGTGPAMSVESLIRWRAELALENRANETLVELSDGRVIEVQHQPMPDGGWVATHEDVTARYRAEARISHMAQHDTLTGLANRALFQSRIEAALSSTRRDHLTAVLCLDLDRFKPVNDCLGHQAGDRLLQMVADRLRSCVRDGDTIGRIGGDEFTILATHLRERQEAVELATRVINRLSVPFELEGTKVSVGASIGIALMPRDGRSAEALLKKADIALYRAKADQPGSFRIFKPEMQARIVARLHLEAELRQAILSEQFEIHYQPLVNLYQGRVSAFEALVRWRSPTRGLVPPAEFIPSAEENGLIIPLGRWILEQACRDAVTWPAEITVSVNLSPVQLRHPDLVRSVTDALASSGLAPARLELEITETVLMENGAATLAALQALNRIGVRISMDDFGTGYSSLSYLRSFPFDKVKIDQSFIQGLSEREDSVAIVRAIVGLCNSLKLVTTAEGVETEEQLARLRDEGCTEVQGFLLGRPKPASEVQCALDEWAVSGRQAASVPGRSRAGAAQTAVVGDHAATARSDCALV